MKELIRVFNYFEANDLKSYLLAHNIMAEIPDEHMLGIYGATHHALGTGRV